MIVFAISDITLLTQEKSNSAWVLDHVGHAVKDLCESIKFYSEVLGFKEETREQVPDQNVAVSFLKLANTNIELLAPLGESSQLTKFLTTRGEGLHHVCYRVPSVSEELVRLSKAGIQLVDQKARLGSRGMQVAFIHPRSMHGVLVELCSVD